MFGNLCLVLAVCALGSQFARVASIAVPKVYPKSLDLDSYSSYKLEFASDDSKTQARYTEYTTGVKRRMDLETVSPQPGLISFRTNGRKGYSILSNLELGYQTCDQNDNLELAFVTSDIMKTSWKFAQNGSMLYVGEQLVKDVNCNVWRYAAHDRQYELYTTLAEEGGDSGSQRLQQIVSYHDLGNEEQKTSYFDFAMHFNQAIADDTYEVPPDLNCN